MPASLYCLATSGTPPNFPVSWFLTCGENVGLHQFIERQTHLVHLFVLLVDGGDEEIVGDVLKVTSVLEPGAGGGDVVGGAFALHLDQDPHISEVCANPLVEGREKLQSVRGGGDIDLHTGAILGWGLVGVFPRVESSARESITIGIIQLQLRTIGTGDT